MPAVTVPALICAAALVRARRAEPRRLTPRLRLALLAPLLPLALFAFVGQVGNSALVRSDRALERGDVEGSLREARRARTWAPWSAEPWQRLGEAQLAAGRDAAARRSFAEAIERDPERWDLWAQFAGAGGGPAAAAEARRLNPREPEAAAAS